MALVARIAELVGRGSQFLVATRSPIVLAVHRARILQIDNDGTTERVSYDDAEPVTLTPSNDTSPSPTGSALERPSKQRRPRPNGRDLAGGTTFWCG